MNREGEGTLTVFRKKTKPVPSPPRDQVLRVVAGADRSDKSGRSSHYHFLVVEQSPTAQLVTFYNPLLDIRFPILLRLEMPWVYYGIHYVTGPASDRRCLVYYLGARPTPLTQATDLLYALPLPNQYNHGRVCPAGVGSAEVVGGINGAVIKAVTAYWAEYYCYHDVLTSAHLGLYNLVDLHPKLIPGAERGSMGLHPDEKFLDPYLAWETWTPEYVATLPWGLYSLGTVADFGSGGMLTPKWYPKAIDVVGPDLSFMHG